MALHSANFNITRLFGPALAGFLIATVGTAFVLWVNVASYFVSIGLLLAMHAAPSARSQAGSAWATLVEGLAYIWHTPTVLMLVLMSVLPFLLGQQYQTMLPVFAKDVLSIGPEGLGLLTAATAAGSLVGTFGVAALGDIKSKGLVLMVSVTAYAALIVAFALSPWALLSAGLLFAVGAANQVYQTTNGTLLQLQVPSEYRGRVMGVHQLDRGFIPVGGFMAGALAEAGGAPFATGLLAAILVVFCLAVAAFVPRMRAIR
jgi:MFS family permease